MAVAHPPSLRRRPGLREGDLLAARAARTSRSPRPRSPSGSASRPRRHRRWSSASSRSAWSKREPYHGVELTPAGERVALEVIRHHRLLELYLAEALGMPWDRVHEEAEVLEHAISPELSELIARQARQPDPRSARRPDPHRRGRDRGDARRARSPTWRRASAAPSRACRTPIPRCCATSPSAGIAPRRRVRGRGPRALRRPAHGARRQAASTPSARAGASMRVERRHGERRTLGRGQA